MNKEAIMRGKKFLRWFTLSVVLLLLPFSALAAKEEKSLIGDEVPFFTLPSSQDRAINYLNEYYGKYYLVMTFFPAAFTPV
jgi:hypothetical protein